MSDLISKEAAIAAALKTRDEAKAFGMPQMAMGAAKVADDLRALPPATEEIGQSTSPANALAPVSPAKEISREAAKAREVFAGSCSAAIEAINYLEQLVLAALPPAQEVAPRVSDCAVSETKSAPITAGETQAASAVKVKPLEWVEGPDVPREWEGQQAWKLVMREGRDPLPLVERVPHGFSRDPKHCGGVWFSLVSPPELPAPVLEGAEA